MSIQIEFLSTAVLAEKQGQSRINFLLDSIKADKIIVLEDPLTFQEEKTLIEATMAKISPDFPGIEISTLGNHADDLKTQLIRLLGGKTSGLTVIGPSNLIQKVKKAPHTINLLAGDGKR